jgi:hypothetical protein
MRFEGLGDQPEFPPAASDAEAIAEIAEKLAEFRPEIDPTWVPSGPPPEQAPLITIGATSFGCSFHASPLMNALPDTPFFISAGFEIGFGLLTIHRPESAWRQLVQIIERKDRQGSDELLITAGGPDRDGYSFPSEELAAEIALGFEAEPPMTKHLAKVRLHFWTTGRVVELVPERREIVEPMYRGGLVPAHLHLGQPPEIEQTQPDSNE